MPKQAAGLPLIALGFVVALLGALGGELGVGDANTVLGWKQGLAIVIGNALMVAGAIAHLDRRPPAGGARPPGDSGV